VKYQRELCLAFGDISVRRKHRKFDNCIQQGPQETEGKENEGKPRGKKIRDDEGAREYVERNEIKLRVMKGIK
jgi:hypothetical protein